MAEVDVQEPPKEDCSSSKELMTLFGGLQQIFESEQDRKEKIRTVVREIEQATRSIHTAIQAAHHCALKDVPALCSRIRPMFTEPKTHIQTLKELVPCDSYYRFNDQFKYTLQRLCFLSSFLIYLESEKLALKSEVAVMLGVEVKPEDGFHLDLDDFLIGLLSMTSEMPRLAVNSVILGDYKRPFAISSFLADVTAGFRLLNLKNDLLRKKFDSLKYDVKKVEEIVYDVSIRKFKTD